MVRALRRRGVPRGPADLLVIPVAAQVTTLPVIVALSGQVSPAALPANLAVALVVPPALVLGFLATVVGPLLPGAAQSLIRVDGPLLSWITGVAHTLARQPGATLAWPATPGGIAGLIGALAIVLLAARHRRSRAVVAGRRERSGTDPGAGRCGRVSRLATARLVAGRLRRRSG